MWEIRNSNGIPVSKPKDVIGKSVIGADVKIMLKFMCGECGVRECTGLTTRSIGTVFVTRVGELSAFVREKRGRFSIS
jgi:hypothetical protein